MVNAPPKVCVGIMTFNQARFIGQALDGVLSQKMDYEFEIVVHDDCSTDGTREIVEEYVATYPGKVRAILQAENQFSQGRRILPILLAEMRGEYFALLDGDDYWHSDLKLQAQVEFLDANSGCALCQTKTVYANETKKRFVTIFPPENRRQRRHDIADLAQGNFIQTSAVMFRASAVPVFPPAYEKLRFGDYPLFGLLSQEGWIGLIDEEMTTYRIHGTNLWAGKSQKAREEDTREVLQFLAEYLKPEYRQPWAEAANAPPSPLSRNLVNFLSRLRQQLGLAPVMPRLRRVLRIKPR